MLEVFLIVDDEESDRVLAEFAILKYNPNATVHQARNGAEALELLASLESVPDVILLDINMPLMNGHEFLAAYAEQGANVPTVVMLTSSRQASDREQASAFDCVVDYIDKPLEAADCERIERQILGN